MPPPGYRLLRATSPASSKSRKRTAQIEGEAGPKIAEYEKLLGRTLTPAERVSVVKTAVLKTRPGKEHLELSALHEHWTGKAHQAGFSSDQVLATVRAAAARARVDPAPRYGATSDRTLAGTLARPAGTLAETVAGPPGGDRQAPLGTGSAGAGDLPGVVPSAAAVAVAGGSRRSGRRGGAGRCSPAPTSRGRSRPSCPRAA